MDFEHARANMLEQQIRTWDVLDQVTLDLIADTHREDFVPAEYRQLALADVCIPLAHGQTTMTPKVEARLIQSLQIQSDDKVLEIGTGCAYLTALLAKAAQTVHSVDIFEVFTREARDKIQGHNINNVDLVTADGLHGWDKQAPYDVIVVTGSIPELDLNFQQQLATGGRLFVVVGESPAMEALLITRIADNDWSSECLFETDLAALVGAEQTQNFEF